MLFSDDQAVAYDAISAMLEKAGVDLNNARILPQIKPRRSTLAVLGKAGSGKTMLLAKLAEALKEVGVEIVSPDYESHKASKKRSLAILAPTNKAASVLRNHSVPATTIHRILYTPLYDPEYEKIAEWLSGRGEKPEIEGLTEAALERAFSYFQKNQSIPGALASAGLRGSDFILGWKRRDAPLDIGFVDEASMIDEKQLADLQEVFTTLVLFGDPAQLAPVGQSGAMIFETIDAARRLELHRVHRQAQDNPILDLAHALGDPDLDFEAFEQMIAQIAKQDERVQVATRADADLMTRSPVLVWRNATRIRLIQAFRRAYDAPAELLLPGEPLICDGIELPVKHRKKRIDLEARGLVKGAQVVYLGQGKKPGFARLHVIGAPDPQVSAASIIQIEAPDQDQSFIAEAARMGATFVHGAACTIHKAQGSQWPAVQLFAPDIYAASRSGRDEAGIPLWKRLAYVAITRAQERLYWVTRYRLRLPSGALDVADLPIPAKPTLTLEAPEG